MEGEILLQYFLISSQRRNGYVQHRPRCSPFHPQATPKPFHPPLPRFWLPPFRVWTLPPFCPPSPLIIWPRGSQRRRRHRKRVAASAAKWVKPPSSPSFRGETSGEFRSVGGRRRERETGKEVQRGRRYHLTSSFRSFLHTTSLFCPQGEEGPPNERHGEKTGRRKGGRRRGLICPPLAFTNDDKVLPRFVIRCWAWSKSFGLRCFDKKRKARVGVASSAYKLEEEDGGERRGLTHLPLSSAVLHGDRGRGLILPPFL